MLKIFLFVSLMFCSVFAEVDGHLDIVKKGMVLPKIVVTIATDSPEKGTLSKINFTPNPPTIIMLVGLQGSRKNNDSRKAC